MPHRIKTTDLWHVGIAHAPITDFLSQDQARPAITWLPRPKALGYLADPFAVPNPDGNGITVFVEALDYAEKKGEIHYYRYDAAWQLVDSGCALRKRTHLSYPFVFVHEGGYYMLPEASRSGRLTLYRAVEFPRCWEPVATLLDCPVVDASLLSYEGRWWLFFAQPGPDLQASRAMYVAYAEDLLGEWTLHSSHPVREGLKDSRMGGTPFLHAGAVYLPVQDCRVRYGGALDLLRVEVLTPERFEAVSVASVPVQGWHPDFSDGMHTLAACGAVTLLDLLRVEPRTAKRVWLDCYRKLRHPIRKWRAWYQYREG